ncbi:Magnetosome protein Mad4 [Desulfovibrionales bacterium]
MKLPTDIKASLALLEAYLGLRLQSLAIFGLSIVAMAGVVTGIYWGVYGFNHWQKEMVISGRLMTATATVPMQTIPQQLTAGQVGQYICPVHGVVGLPRFNAIGQPLCPVGGETMQLQYLPGAGIPQSKTSMVPTVAVPAAWVPGAG